MSSFETHFQRMQPQLARIRDARQRKRLRQLEAESTTDALTGLPNRRAYDLALEEKMDAGRRGLSFTLVIVDIDHFKKINDSRGHRTGDKVLSLLARTMQKFLRKIDKVCRIGGEEFAVLLVHPDPQKNPLIPLERLKEKVEATDFGIGQPVTISIGYATFSPEMDADSLFNAADAALYRAKAEGRNCIRAAEAA